MNISFHGIKNAAAQRYFEDEGQETYRDGKIIKLDKSQHANIHFELTNTNGADLDEWKPILHEYQNMHNPNSIDFTYDEYTNSYTLQKERVFHLNDIPLTTRLRNWKMLAKVYKLLIKVASMTDDEIKTEYSYLSHGTEADDSFRAYKKEFMDKDGHFHASDYRKMVENCHNAKTAKQGARFLCQKIEEAIKED